MTVAVWSIWRNGGGCQVLPIAPSGKWRWKNEPSGFWHCIANSRNREEFS